MRRPVVPILGCVLLVLLALLATGASSARSGAWLWPVAVPGEHIVLGPALRNEATRERLLPGSLRELSTSGEGAARLTLLAGQRDGETVLATQTGARLGTVERLPEAASALRAFTTPDGRVVGVARGDVSRVVAVLRDGRAVELPLNEWRAFAYDDGSPIVSLSAYGADGRTLGSISLPPTAGCGSIALGCTPSATTAAGGTPVYGVFETGVANGPLRRSKQAAVLTRVDPRTLKRIPGPSLRIGRYSGMLALSPSGRRLATAASPNGSAGIVDLDRMRWARRPGASGAFVFVRVIAWPREDRLLEVVQRMSKPYRRYVRARRLVVVDPTSDRVVARRTLTNKLGITGSVSAGGRLVMLMQSSSYRGSTARLVVAWADGSVRQATIEVGSKNRVLRYNQLVVTPAGDRAYVVVSGGLVVDVDLASLATTYHRLQPPAGAPRDIPAVVGLHAALLGRDIAVAGVFGRERLLGGTYLVDTDSWQVRILDPRATFFAPGGDVLATYGPPPFPPGGGPPGRHGIGLSLFGADGKLRFHLYGGRHVQSVEFVLGYGHAFFGVRRSRPAPGAFVSPVWRDRVFDVGTGRPVGERLLSSTSGQPYLIYRGAQSVGEVP
jgi:hypothetical protein